MMISLIITDSLWCVTAFFFLPSGPQQQRVWKPMSKTKRKRIVIHSYLPIVNKVNQPACYKLRFQCLCFNLHYHILINSFIPWLIQTKLNIYTHLNTIYVKHHALLWSLHVGMLSVHFRPSYLIQHPFMSVSIQ